VHYAIFLAGQAEGIDLWEKRADPKWDKTHHVSSLDKFMPRLSDEERDVRFARWRDAVGRSLGWAKTTEEVKSMTPTDRIYASVPAAIFICSSFLLCKIADSLAQNAD